MRFMRESTEFVFGRGEDSAGDASGSQESSAGIPADSQNAFRRKYEQNARLEVKSPFLLKPKAEKTEAQTQEVKDEEYFIRKMRERVQSYHRQPDLAEVEPEK